MAELHLSISFFGQAKALAYTSIGSSGFPVKKYSPQRTSAATPQPKQQSLFHHRGTEFAEFGVFFNPKLFTPRPSRLRGEISFGSIQPA